MVSLLLDLKKHLLNKHGLWTSGRSKLSANDLIREWEKVDKMVVTDHEGHERLVEVIWPATFLV